MAGNTAIYKPTLSINNEIIDYMPNTLVVTLGKGESKVDPQIAGGGGVSMVYSQDVSTQKSKVNFEMKTTPENIELLQTWMNNLNANFINVIDDQSEKSYIFEQGAVINDPELNSGVDGTISVEFESKPLTIG